MSAQTGIGRGTINGYCTGRLELGMKNAPRIAEALDVSVLELGAPLEEVDEKGKTLLVLLTELRTEMTAENLKLRKDLRSAIRRIRALEQRAQGGADEGSGS